MNSVLRMTTIGATVVAIFLILADTSEARHRHSRRGGGGCDSSCGQCDSGCGGYDNSGTSDRTGSSQYRDQGDQTYSNRLPPAPGQGNQSMNQSNEDRSSPRNTREAPRAQNRSQDSRPTGSPTT